MNENFLSKSFPKTLSWTFTTEDFNYDEKNIIEELFSRERILSHLAFCFKQSMGHPYVFIQYDGIFFLWLLVHDQANSGDLSF